MMQSNQVLIVRGACMNAGTGQDNTESQQKRRPDWLTVVRAYIN